MIEVVLKNRNILKYLRQTIEKQIVNPSLLIFKKSAASDRRAWETQKDKRKTRQRHSIWHQAGDTTLEPASQHLVSTTPEPNAETGDTGRQGKKHHRGAGVTASGI